MYSCIITLLYSTNAPKVLLQYLFLVSHLLVVELDKWYDIDVM